MRELEKLVKKLQSPEKPARQKEDLTQYQLQFDEYAGRLTERLGTRVQVSLKDKSSGKLEIDFYSSADFDGLYEKLSRQ